MTPGSESVRLLRFCVDCNAPLSDPYAIRDFSCYLLWKYRNQTPQDWPACGYYEDNTGRRHYFDADLWRRFNA